VRGLLVLSSFALAYLRFGTLLTPDRLGGVFILAICVVGIVSAARRVQIVLAILGLLVELFVVGYFRFEAGSWAGPQ
jgi:hypothetical protein